MATARRTSRSSPAPNFWATTTEKPPVRPITNPKTKKEMAPVEPTAARASTPMLRPTTMVSAML